MPSKYLCKCPYCGIKWIDEEQYSWRSNDRKCPHCGETKNIEAKQIPPTDPHRDVFGYRFSPPFSYYGYPQD